MKQEKNQYKEIEFKVMMPSHHSSNHIFNDEKYKVLEVNDEEGNKTILLKEKIQCQK